MHWKPLHLVVPHNVQQCLAQKIQTSLTCRRPVMGSIPSIIDRGRHDWPRLPLLFIVFQERSLSRGKEKDSAVQDGGCWSERKKPRDGRERKGRARKSRVRRRDNVAPVLQVDQAKEVRTEQHNGHEERRKMQNGPSTDEVGIWIKSKRGQRLGNRVISDLEESRPPPPYSTSAFVTSLCCRRCCCFCYYCCSCYCYYCHSVVIRRRILRARSC